MQGYWDPSNDSKEYVFNEETLTKFVTEIGLKDFGFGPFIHEHFEYKNAIEPENGLGQALYELSTLIRGAGAIKAETEQLLLDSVNQEITGLNARAFGNKPIDQPIIYVENNAVPRIAAKNTWHELPQLTEQDLARAKDFKTSNPPLPPTMHNFWGSRKQLAYGQVVSCLMKAAGKPMHPLVAVLLNPTGGICGPADRDVTWFVKPVLGLFLIRNAKLTSLSYHGVVHDAAGYCKTCEGAGPGYTYLKPDSWFSDWCTRGQLSGVRMWSKTVFPKFKLGEGFRNSKGGFTLESAVGTTNEYYAATEVTKPDQSAALYIDLLVSVANEAIARTVADRKTDDTLRAKTVTELQNSKLTATAPTPADEADRTPSIVVKCAAYELADGNVTDAVTLIAAIIEKIKSKPTEKDPLTAAVKAAAATAGDAKASTPATAAAQAAVAPPAATLAAAAATAAAIASAPPIAAKPAVVTKTG